METFSPVTTSIRSCCVQIIIGTTDECRTEMLQVITTNTLNDQIYEK